MQQPASARISRELKDQPDLRREEEDLLRRAMDKAGVGKLQTLANESILYIVFVCWYTCITGIPAYNYNGQNLMWSPGIVESKFYNGQKFIWSPGIVLELHLRSLPQAHAAADAHLFAKSRERAF